MRKAQEDVRRQLDAAKQWQPPPIQDLLQPPRPLFKQYVFFHMVIWNTMLCFRPD